MQINWPSPKNALAGVHDFSVWHREQASVIAQMQAAITALQGGKVTPSNSQGSAATQPTYSGILGIANGGTGLGTLGAANQLLGVNSGDTALEYKNLSALLVQGTGLTIAGTSTVTLSLADTAVTPGSYNFASLTVDQQGRITAASSGAPVTSVGISAPNIFSTSGTPVTTTGTLTLSLATQAANKVWAGPTTGSAATPTFRSLVTADLPAGTGTVTSVALTAPTQFAVSGSPVTSSGTLAISWNSQSANAVLVGPSTGSAAAPTFRALVAADLPAATTGAQGAVQLAQDLGNTGALPKVVGIQGVAVSSTAPTTGQTLQYNGTNWAAASVLSGIAAWSSSTAYTADTLVLGSDHNYYRCKVGNTNNNPTTDSGTNWEAWIITTSITLSVAAAGRFTTPNTAFAYIKNAFIGQNATVTISIANGTYSCTTLNLSHPCGSRIVISGTSTASTILEFASQSGLQIDNGGQFNFINTLTLSLTGTATGTNGILANNSSRIYFGSAVKIQNFANGVFAANNSYISYLGTVSSCTAVGILAFNASAVNCPSATVTSCPIGIESEQGSYVYANAVSVTGSTTYGLYALDGGSIFAYQSTSTSSTSGAILYYALDRGYIFADAFVSMNLSGNMTGIKADVFSNVVATNPPTPTLSGVSNTTYSPSINTSGNANSYIKQ